MYPLRVDVSAVSTPDGKAFQDTSMLVEFGDGACTVNGDERTEIEYDKLFGEHQIPHNQLKTH